MTPELDALFQSKFIRTTNIPTLFHYTSMQRAEQIISDKCWRLSKFDSVNDNREFLFGLKLAHKDFKQRATKDRIFRVIFEKYIEALYSEIKEPSLSVFMACYCQQKSEYLQKKYAGPNGGKITIEFHSDDLKDLPIVCRSVFYSVTLFRKKIRKMISSYQDHLVKNVHQWYLNGHYDERMAEFILSFHRDLFVLSAFFKRRKYRNEREYRLVMWKPNDDTDVVIDQNRKYVHFYIKNTSLSITATSRR